MKREEKAELVLASTAEGAFHAAAKLLNAGMSKEIVSALLNEGVRHTAKVRKKLTEEELQRLDARVADRMKMADQWVGEFCDCPEHKKEREGNSLQ